MAEREASPSIRVLLVDDQPMIGEVIRRMLAHEQDISCETCTESKEALEAAHRTAANVILQDLAMPDIDGFDLLRLYQEDERTRDVPVIMLTGKEDAESKARAFALGASDYLVKLPDQIELVARIRRHAQSYINLRQRLLTEEALRVAEAAARRAADEADAANRAKTTFLANMSHEIRTPMNAILGYAQILTASDDLSEAQRSAIETIYQSGEHLLGLINDVLDISRIEAGRQDLALEDMDLKGLVNALGAMFAVRCQEKELRWRLDEDLPGSTVRGDLKKLRQVMINLLGNAMKFTDEGEVVLSARRQADDYYLFEVSDTGPGIPVSRQQAIFDPFHQEEAGQRHGGTGLGLAIARGHVELMGGKLRVDSGSTGSRFSFSVHLPPGKDGTETDPHSLSRVARLAEGCSVRALVVDALPSNRDVLKQLLAQIGVDVDTADSGEQALDRVRESRPDIVFLAMRLPGMDGAETRKRLTDEQGDSMRFVCVTASVFAHERQKLVDLGFERILHKPLRSEDVYGCLADQLDVKFEYREPATVPDTSAGRTSWGELRLPAELADKLKSSAESQSVTELSRHLDEVAALGAAGESLATHLRELSRRFDMNSIRDVLKDVETT